MVNIRWKVAQAAEIRWWQQYLNRKPPASYLAWKRRYWVQLLLRTGLDLQPGQSILDAGCGPAGIFMILSEQWVDAVDPLIDQYSAKLAHFSPADYPSTRFFNTPLEKFELSTRYDVVFCFNAINHVNELEICLDKLVAATRTDGYLVVSVDTHKYTPVKEIFRLFPGDLLHPHQYDLKEYRDMFISRNCILQNCFLHKKGKLFNYFILIMKVHRPEEK